jgi:hypothetical protein
MVLGLASGIVGEVIIVALIAAVLFVIFKLSSMFLKLVFGIIINSIAGLVAIVALDYIFNMGITIGLATLLPSAIFGLPGVGTIVILKLLGVQI